MKLCCLHVLQEMVSKKILIDVREAPSLVQLQNPEASWTWFWRLHDTCQKLVVDKANGER